MINVKSLVKFRFFLFLLGLNLLLSHFLLLRLLILLNRETLAPGHKADLLLVDVRLDLAGDLGAGRVHGLVRHPHHVKEVRDRVVLLADVFFEVKVCKFEILLGQVAHEAPSVELLLYGLVLGTDFTDRVNDQPKEQVKEQND